MYLKYNILLLIGYINVVFKHLPKGKVKGGKMKLWTIQPMKVLEIIEKEGVFHCNPKSEEFSYDFTEAYLWICKKMDEKFSRPESCTFPIWAWHTRNWKHKKPDLRNVGLGYKGQEYACIELEIPDEKVLLSDYILWHYVLNDSWIDDSTNEQEWEEQNEWFDSLPVKEKEKLKIESWNKIINPKTFENDWVSIGKFIQATFWEIRKENVKKVQKFVAR